jgi:hypothetical protein
MKYDPAIFLVGGLITGGIFMLLKLPPMIPIAVGFGAFLTLLLWGDGA